MSIAGPVRRCSTKGTENPGYAIGVCRNMSGDWIDCTVCLEAAFPGPLLSHAAARTSFSCSASAIKRNPALELLNPSVLVVYSTAKMLVAAEFFNGEPFTIDIRSEEAVAFGGTAQIFVGDVVWDNRSTAVAVKAFKTMLSVTEKTLLSRELEIARQVSLRHPSILEFLGTAKMGLETSIVSLYMRNGNLRDYLKLNQDVDRKNLILEVAEAVNYLHTVEGLVHGDLKCANVLISDFGVALLADFGLSTFIEKAQSSETTATDARTKYTLRFAAPELLNDSAGLPERRRSKTRETDVYAFGMLVLEAITGQSPWFGVKEEIGVLLRVQSGNVPSQPTMDGALSSISHAWWDVLKRCWSYEPSSRPPMRTVLSDLILHSHLPTRDLASPNGPHGDIVAAVYMPCGQRLTMTTSGGDGYINGIQVAPPCLWIYDIASCPTVVVPIRGPTFIPRLLAVSADGQQIAIACSNAIARWDVATRALHSEPTFLKADICAFSPDTKWVVCRFRDCTICFWNASAGRLIGPLTGHTHDVCCVAFSPAGTHVVSASSAEERGELLLWHVPSGKKLAAAMEPGAISCLCFFPDGEHIATGSRDGKVSIWNARTLALERSFYTANRAV